MPAFLDDFSAFAGDGSSNEDGLNLEEYLEQYNPAKYRAPSVTTDIMVLKYNKSIKSVYEGLSLLMVRRRNHPCIGLWALPGGFCEINEDIEESAKRELLEETGLSDISIEQIRTWGEAWRDPRDRVITVEYVALVDESVNEPVAGDDAAQAAWFDVRLEVLSQNEIYENNRKILRTEYRISLSYESETDCVHCNADVTMSENSDGPLRERHYCISNNNIAFDHARFIVEGLLYIQKSLES